MVASATPFPDLEEGLIVWAKSLYPDAYVWDELPTEYAEALPVVVIEVDGGMSDGLTQYATATLSVYAADTTSESGRKVARDVAVNLCSRMTVYPRHFGGIVVDTVEVADWPSRSKAQEPDERTYCFAGEVMISLRRK